MIQKNFDAIEKSDIDALISNHVVEIKTLEYKQELPGSTDEAKKEFLADITSFANASGGDLVFGIKAARDEHGKATGEPEAVLPISGANADEAKLRLEEIIRAGIAPRIPVQIRQVSGFGADGRGFVVVVRVPKSIASPHVVTFRGSFRFFSRNSAGKYSLDVNELRSAFLATESQSERIKRFLETRLGAIVADETPFPLFSKHRLVLHVIPIPSFLNNDRLDLTNLFSLSQAFLPLGGGAVQRRHNLDGFISSSGSFDDGKTHDGYCQLFFNGTVEMVESDIIRGDQGGRIAHGTGGIASVAYEQWVIDAIRSYFRGYKNMDVAPPLLISMALLGCKGCYLHVKPMFTFRFEPTAIDRDTAILPIVEVDNFEADVPKVMKPIFDAVWNSCGYPRSLNYDENGNWKPQR